MKTLSVKQPYAYLLCAGIKDVENRTWKLPEKLKGERVLIHSSSKIANRDELLLNNYKALEISNKPYSNAYTSRALRTVRQFFYNMQTAIWVRDVPFNIKGFMSNEDMAFEKYKNNIKIIDDETRV